MPVIDKPVMRLLREQREAIKTGFQHLLKTQSATCKNTLAVLTAIGAAGKPTDVINLPEFVKKAFVEYYNVTQAKVVDDGRSSGEYVTSSLGGLKVVDSYDDTLLQGFPDTDTSWAEDRNKRQQKAQPQIYNDPQAQPTELENIKQGVGDVTNEVNEYNKVLQDTIYNANKFMEQIEGGRNLKSS